MKTADLGAKIHAKAIECGYENCGVVLIDALDVYKDHLEKRMDRFPESAAVYESPVRFIRLKELYPWAKAVIICTEYYGRFRFPDSLQGRYAKSYLMSSAVPEHPARDGKKAFEKWMREEGVRFEGGETNMPGKILPLRQAAVSAGLGIFRKNNFFYGPKGSWYGLEGYLIDRECEYVQEADLKPCSPKCDLCQRACGTKALCDAFTMNPMSCISFWTTFGGGNVPPQLTDEQFGEWIMGCDACQDACPYNRRHDWREGDTFPGLDDLEELLQPENIIRASEQELADRVIPRSEYHLTKEQTDTLRRCADRVWKRRNPL